jgi:hypothetical protein
MKNLIFTGAIMLAFFYACSDGNRPEINGMWQLKTIQDENQDTQTVDTIFYSFQRQAIFAYTLLREKEGEPATSAIVYGFIDFPDDNHLHIQIDKNYKEDANLLKLLPWNWDAENVTNDVTYDIIKLDSKSLILFNKKKTYHFIKY